MRGPHDPLQKILKSFTKAIDQLEQLTAANNVEVSRNTEQIDRLQEKNMLLIAEAQAAKETAENLKSLIGQ
ncbi:hypothetical protein [Stutzerimonas kunmingensis]|uniref:hypothetical protein n=1 Tax=Stutzerimonas kunmingensis TaxID=1211807 RepID=UPI0024200CCF|nr:hypothetical protein [Stutzerimonas kunmingensis]